jgi:hypothetical protein
MVVAMTTAATMMIAIMTGGALSMCPGISGRK